MNIRDLINTLEKLDIIFEQDNTLYLKDDIMHICTKDQQFGIIDAKVYFYEDGTVIEVKSVLKDEDF